ncbi:hypothetical protein AVEN_100030-1 [Araneus ventricosus]|uniref:Uncharacterized protein n=1 Tax=Araneus ventricosus TaxID=182803 RepID=A0A4Y2NWI1_ARAVE|nr:hypothetical protein AVEN_100030-1 [Araneus ventricosus]
MTKTFNPPRPTVHDKLSAESVLTLKGTGRSCALVELAKLRPPPLRDTFSLIFHPFYLLRVVLIQSSKASHLKVDILKKLENSNPFYRGTTRHRRWALRATPPLLYPPREREHAYLSGNFSSVNFAMLGSCD